MKNRAVYLFVLTLFILFVVGCEIEGSEVPGPGTRDVVASAGDDVTVSVNGVVELSAQGSSEGEGVRYAWSLLSQPEESRAVLEDAEAFSARLTPDVAGEYVVRLEVSLESEREQDEVVVSAIPRATSGVELQPGGTIEAPFGIQFSAAEGALEETTTIFIEEAQEIEKPLPEDIQAVTSFYQYSSSRRTFTGPPVSISIPVPGSADEENLALMLLVPGEDIEFSMACDREEGVEQIETCGPFTVDDVWLDIEGEYNPKTNLFTAELYYFPEDRQTFVLAQNEYFKSLTELERELGEGIESQQAPRFWPYCHSEFERLSRDDECLTTDQTNVQAFLRDAYQSFSVNAGYGQPRLLNPVPFLAYLVFVYPYTPVGPDEKVGRCNYQFDPVTESVGMHNLGMYYSGSGTMYVCAGDRGDTVISPSEALVRHEYFHAIQYASKDVRKNRDSFSDEDEDTQVWWIEGMTVATERSSLNTWDRASRTLQDIDVPLDEAAGLKEYEAQDFWIFMGEFFGEDLSFFKEFFSYELTTKGVDSKLQDDHSTTIGDIYWEWVKNQAFEARYTLGGELSGQCQFNRRALADGVIRRAFTPSSGLDDTSALTIPALTSRIVELSLNEDPSLDYLSYDATISVSSSDPNFLRYKVYDPASAPSTTCYNDREGSVVKSLSYLDTSQTHYILISNTRRGAEMSVNLTMSSTVDEAEPLSVSFEDPGDNASFYEGYWPFDPTLAVSSPNMQGTLNWTLGGAGPFSDTVSTTQQSVSLAGYEGSVATPCPGQYVSSANLKDDFFDVSDQVVYYVMQSEFRVEIDGPSRIDVELGGPQPGVRLVGEASQPTCNDPLSERLEQGNLEWSWSDGSGNAKTQSGPKVFIPLSDFGYSSITVDLVYLERGAVLGRSQTIITPCSSTAIFVRGEVLGDYPPCTPYSGIPVDTDRALYPLEGVPTPGEVAVILSGRFEESLEKFELTPDVFPPSRRDIVEQLDPNYSNAFTKLVSNLYEITAEGRALYQGGSDALLFEAGALTVEGELSETELILFVNAVSAVDEALDAFSAPEEGGSNGWRYFTFTYQPESEEFPASLVERVDTFEPVRGALDGFLLALAEGEGVIESEEQIEAAREIARYGSTTSALTEAERSMEENVRAGF